MNIVNFSNDYKVGTLFKIYFSRYSNYRVKFKINKTCHVERKNVSSHPRSRKDFRLKTNQSDKVLIL